MDEQTDFKSFDGHVHSYFSFDVKERPELSPVSLFYAGIGRGMDFVTITDHDEFRQNEMIFEALKEKPELLKKFVSGTEFTVEDKKYVGHIIHVNVYTLTRTDFETLISLRNDLFAFTEYCRKRDLPFQYNHPVWFDQKEDSLIGEKNLKAILQCGKLFDVVEACNSNRPIEENNAAEMVARILGKGMTSNSDSHFGNVGVRGYTKARGKTFREFWANVKAGKSQLVKDHMTPEILKGKVLLTIDHLAFPSGMRSVNNKYGCDTGNVLINKILRTANKFPLVVRALRPYLRSKVRRTTFIDRYIQRQNLVGLKALRYFAHAEKAGLERTEESIKSYL